MARERVSGVEFPCGGASAHRRNANQRLSCAATWRAGERPTSQTVHRLGLASDSAACARASAACRKSHRRGRAAGYGAAIAVDPFAAVNTEAPAKGRRCWAPPANRRPFLISLRLQCGPRENQAVPGRKPTVPLPPVGTSALKSWKLACRLSPTGLGWPPRSDRDLQPYRGSPFARLRSATAQIWAHQWPRRPKYRLHSFPHIPASMML
jgi:hypothetical protein